MSQTQDRPVEGERHVPSEVELDLYWQQRNAGHFGVAEAIYRGWNAGRTLAGVSTDGDIAWTS